MTSRRTAVAAPRRVAGRRWCSAARPPARRRPGRGCARTWCWSPSRTSSNEFLEEIENAQVVVEGVEVLLAGVGEQGHQLAVDLVQLAAAALEVRPARAVDLAVVPARRVDGERLVPGLEEGALVADGVDQQPLHVAQPLGGRQTVQDRDEGIDAASVLLHRLPLASLRLEPGPGLHFLDDGEVDQLEQARQVGC